MTSKEALEELKIYLPAIYSEVAKCLNTIKQDLERLEQLEKENQELKDKLKEPKYKVFMGCRGGGRQFAQHVEIIKKEKQKLKKAIEIIKDSLHLKVDFYDYDYDYKFIIKVGGLFEHISSEEYELLKEVLEDDK